MRELPAPIKSVRVPRTFSPSKLSGGLRCRLRMIGAGADRTLSAGPEAALGTILHRLLEDAAQGHVGVGTGSRVELSEALDSAIESWRSRHESTPAMERFHDLRSAFSAREFDERTGPSLRALGELAGRRASQGPRPVARSARPSTGKRTLRLQDLAVEGAWAEVRIESLKWRVTGTADRVEKSHGNRLVITDYKTGRTHDADGVLESIKIQLHAYGLAALALEPESMVTLKVKRDQESEVAFEPEKYGVLLEGLTAGLAEDSEVPSSDIVGEVGPKTCIGCPIRDRCHAYRTEAPRLWRGTPEWPMPLDVWGRVIEERRRESESDVRLMDPLGQARLVKRVCHNRHGLHQPLGVGDPLWFFGLKAQATRRRDGTWLAPTVFHDLAELRRGGRPAWVPVAYIQVGGDV